MGCCSLRFCCCWPRTPTSPLDRARSIQPHGDRRCVAAAVVALCAAWVVEEALSEVLITHPPPSRHINQPPSANAPHQWVVRRAGSIFLQGCATTFPVKTCSPLSYLEEARGSGKSYEEFCITRRHSHASVGDRGRRPHPAPTRTPDPRPPPASPDAANLGTAHPPPAPPIYPPSTPHPSLLPPPPLTA